MTQNRTRPPQDGASLYWIPLGADGNPVVRLSGRLYEAGVARRQHRPRRPLFHSALVVRVDGARFAVEMAPVWSDKHADRGVVGEGPVGLPWLGRSRLFRYEIRRWRDGVIPDIDQAVDGPVDLGIDEDRTRSLLDLVPHCPTPTWGRDELGVGDMWNSNSLVAWLVESAGLPGSDMSPPRQGRAPGWAAGLQVARQERPSWR